MDWLKELLKNAGIENVEELEKSISKELPKYFKPAKEFNEINEELKVIKGEKKTLEDDKKKIEDEYNNFKKGSISQADYEAKKKEIEDSSKAEIEKIRLESKIELAISNAKARNVKSVKANLNLDNIKLDGDKLLGFDDQIEALKKSDAYLFNIEKEIDDGNGEEVPGKKGTIPPNNEPTKADQMLKTMGLK